MHSWLILPLTFRAAICIMSVEEELRLQAPAFQSQATATSRGTSGARSARTPPAPQR